MSPVPLVDHRTISLVMTMAMASALAVSIGSLVMDLITNHRKNHG
jgi:hypothetical protein